MKHNQSKYFLSCLPLYNFVFTTKSTNLKPEELPSLGAKNVTFIKQAFDPSVHRPIAIDQADREKFGSDVSFVGTYEPIRKEKLLFLAESGIQVRVWGNGWNQYVDQHPNLKVENKPVYDDDYIKTICASKINIGFCEKLIAICTHLAVSKSLHVEDLCWRKIARTILTYSKKIKKPYFLTSITPGNFCKK